MKPLVTVLRFVWDHPGATVAGALVILAMIDIFPQRPFLVGGSVIIFSLSMWSAWRQASRVSVAVMKNEQAMNEAWSAFIKTLYETQSRRVAGEPEGPPA